MIVVTQEIQSELLTKRGVNEISRRANRLQMTRHKTDRLPLHFEHVPEAKPGGGWGYDRRSKAYQISKAKKYGHTKLLVASGDLRDAVLRSARVTATKSKASLKARGTRESSLRRKYRDEMEAVTKAEDKEHSESWLESFTAFASDDRYKAKRKRK